MAETPRTIIYTHTDEAPALATASLLPVIQAFSAAAGVTVELRDISLAARVLAAFPDFLEEGHHHHHDAEMQSISVRHPGEVHPERFMPWLSDLTQREGPNILRCKGIVAFPDEPRRFVFQGVHMMLEGDVQRAWKPDEPRESRVVFIGRSLDEAAIRDGFLACAA